MGEFAEGAKRGAGLALMKVIGAVLALAVTFAGGYATGDHVASTPVPQFDQDDD